MRLRLADESGIALILTLGILLATSFMLVTVIQYSSDAGRGANRSKADQVAYALAEAGINNAMSVLANPTNNALNSTLLPARVSTYENGTVTWSGSFNPMNARWTLTSVSTVRNPTGPTAAPVSRRIVGQVDVVPTLSQPLNSQAWNYIYSRGTGNTCDMTIQQTVAINSPLLVSGNLCLRELVLRAQGAARRGRKRDDDERKHDRHGGEQDQPRGDRQRMLQEQSSGRVPESLHRRSRRARLCRRRFEFTAGDPAALRRLEWLVRQRESGAVLSVHDDDRNTPAVREWRSGGAAQRRSDEEEQQHPVCRRSDACGLVQLPHGGGDLTWDAVNKVLTVNGTMYIDGSVKIENGAVNSYTGFATIYVSGTVLIKNSSMCAVIVAGACSTQNWTSNSRMLVFVVGGNGSNTGHQSRPEPETASC